METKPKTPIGVFFPLRGKPRNLLRGRGDIHAKFNKILPQHLAFYTEDNKINIKFNKVF